MRRKRAELCQEVEVGEVKKKPKEYVGCEER